MELATEVNKITESVTEQSLQQALTYDYLYRQSQHLPSMKCKPMS